ncbi:isopentenyl-diphosphate Delta-isomerase, partial [Lecanoromycetidae sp. Uapishka_2]
MGSNTTRPQEVTADNVRELFPGVDTHLADSHRVPTNDIDLRGYDEEQIRLMGEVCIILDKDDAPIGSSSKKYLPGETGSTLEDAIQGTKRAAIRKLDQELGIKSEQVQLEMFKFLTRIHYKAPSDGKWGEHEIDYILFIKADVDITPNPNEVKDTRYVSESQLKTMFEDNSLKFTPWFKLICNTMLFEWWEHLDNGLEKYAGEKVIRRM